MSKLSDLNHKRRTVKDLVRFIQTRSDQNPNYSLLLGAGASITSGIRSASELIKLWRSELCSQYGGDPSADENAQREYLRRNCSPWYDDAKEYSSLFEKKYDLQRQRRIFVETEVAGKTPSMGYAFLVSLVNANYLNTIFTTNFDDLLNEAFFLFSDQRPIVCAHDSSINSVTVTSKRPKIIKIHGDYLFDDLKSTVRETESLEQNMRQKFSEFAKDYGLVVVGYGGGDRSVMDAISALLKSDDYFKNGIYWCIRRGDEVNEELRKLLWRDRVYFVEIDGFDELFAELYYELGLGGGFPLSGFSLSRRPADIVRALVSNSYISGSSSLYIQQARRALEKESKKNTIYEMLRQNERRDEERDVQSSGQALSDDEIISLMAVQELIDRHDYREAISKGRESSSVAGISKTARRRLLVSVARAQSLSGDDESASATMQEVCDLYPHSARYHLERCHYILKMSDRLEVLNKAVEVDPYSSEAHYRLALHFEYGLRTCFGQARADLLGRVLGYLEKSLVLQPDYYNPAWQLKFDVLSKFIEDRQKRQDAISSLIEKLSLQRPLGLKVLKMRGELLRGEKNAGDISALLGDFLRAKERAEDGDKDDFEIGIWEFLKSIEDYQQLTSRLDAVDVNSGRIGVRLAVAASEILREVVGDEEKALKLLEPHADGDHKGVVAVHLISLYADTGRLNDAQRVFDHCKNVLGYKAFFDMQMMIAEAKGDIDGALAVLRRAWDLGYEDPTSKVYLLLKKAAFSEAKDEAKRVLEQCNFSLSAAAEIVNLELAKKQLGDKVKADRLRGLLAFDKSSEVAAAIYYLLDDRVNMLAKLKAAQQADKTFRYRALRWPVFDKINKDADFINALEC